MKILIVVVVLLWSTLVFADQANLSWQNSGVNDGTEIQRNLNAGAWQAQAITAANAASYVDATLVQTTTASTYCYRIRAVLKDGKGGFLYSTWTTGSSATPSVPGCAVVAAIPQPPSAPIDLKVNGAAAAAVQQKAPAKAKK